MTINPKHNNKDNTILLVDDNPVNLDLLISHLRKDGYKISIAKNGKTALKRAEYLTPDLILLDIQMPEMDGYETCQKLKKNPITHDIPVIFMSALTDTVDKLKGFKVGGVDYITKPFHESELLARVKIHTSLAWMHKRLEEQNILLQQEILERKKAQEALKQSKEEAENANRSKSEFLANMSHEIRTPMNAVIGLTILALKTKLSAKQLDYLTKIQASAEGLLGIINDILDFSKIEAGKLTMESIDFQLDDVLKSVSTVIGNQAEVRGVEVLYSVDPKLPHGFKGDPLRLSQILINLVSNSVKFTEKGEIIIRGELLEQTGSRVKLKFSVKDTGIGMSPKQTASLFQPFCQVDGSTTRKYGGTGLGLTICKRLVEMMDGAIWVTSKVKKGSTFVFAIWLDHTSECDQPVPCTVPDLSGLRCLVVDDNEAAREIMVQTLIDLGMKAEMATSGKVCLEKTINQIKEAPYDIIFMDWKMPEMDGMETIKLLKATPEFMEQPSTTIMVTAFGREEVWQKAKEIGVDGFLVKPINRSLLVDVLIDLYGVSEKDVLPDRVTDKDSFDFRGVHILLVEDHEINRQVAIELLESVGVKVSVAVNGVEAVDKVIKGHGGKTFDAVLMDLQMPEMDGYEATRLIRAKEAFSDLPIIGLTAHALAEERDKCLRVGMNDHVSKPIIPDALFTAIDRWVEKREKDGLPPLAPTSLADETNLPVLPGINTEEGVARVAGNLTLYNNLLKGFVRNYAEYGSKISQALHDKEFPVAQGLSHTLKGVSGNIGAAGLHKASGALEDVINKGEQEKINSALKGFEKEFDSIINVLSQFLDASKKQEPNPQLPGTIDFDELKAQLVKLTSRLEQFDTMAEDLFDECRQKLLFAGYETLTTQLEEYMNNLEYEKGLEIVNKLIVQIDRDKNGGQ